MKVFLFLSSIRIFEVFGIHSSTTISHTKNKGASQSVISLLLKYSESIKPWRLLNTLDFTTKN